MNADEAARATIIANGRGETPSSAAVEIAMGAMSTAVAVFETNRPMMAVSTKTPPSSTIGPASPSVVSRPSTTRSTPPVRSSASANGSIPTMSSSVGQWMAR